MPAAAAPPSTAPGSPLEDSMKKVLGEDTDLVSYDPNATFRPSGDVLNISTAPGTGTTTAEEWAHQIDLENQRQKSLEFEWQQRMQADENARAAAQLAIQQAEEGRSAALAASQQESARIANLAAQQQMASGAQSMKYATSGEARAAAESASGLRSQQQARAAQAQAMTLADQKFRDEHYGMTPTQYNSMLVERDKRAAFAESMKTNAYNQYMEYPQRTSVAIPVPAKGGGYSPGTISSTGLYQPAGSGMANYIGAPGSYTYSIYAQNAFGYNPAKDVTPTGDIIVGWDQGMAQAYGPNWRNMQPNPYAKRAASIPQY